MFFVLQTAFPSSQAHSGNPRLYISFGFRAIVSRVSASELEKRYFRVRRLTEVSKLHIICTDFWES